MSRGPVRLGALPSAGLGWLAGTGWQLQAATLSPRLAVGALLCAVLGCAWMGWRRRRLPPAALFVVAAALAWSTTTWRAAGQLQDRLSPALEGVTLTIEGEVRGLPQVSADGVRFDFVSEADGPRLPARLRLGWWTGRAGTAVPAVGPGERWRLIVRLKQVHGLANPGGFDQELQAFEQGVGATGSVQGGRRLRAAEGEWVARARARVREGIRAAVPDPSAAGLLAALSIGDQAAIERADWAVFRATGVAHLVAISGMHVTMFAWLAAALIGRAWRRLGSAPLWCPAVVVARWGGVAAAAGYALLAGWGVPAQRTVWMLAAAALLRAGGCRWPWPLVLGASGLVVVLIDPWALLQPGFWLSFVAVAVLMADGASGADGPDSAATPSRWRWVAQALRTQGRVSVALAPLGLLFFQQVSVIGLLANLLAIPLVSFVITPLALGGVLWSGLWHAAAAVVTPTVAALAWLAQWPGAAWQAPLAPPQGWALAVFGLVLCALPVPRRLRLLGVVAMLPVFLQPAPRPAAGDFVLLGADIGQGNAVLIRTAGHDLLYDTGPQYGPGSDAGERVLVPLLRAQGVGKLDLLVLSHRDGDHTGGAASVLRAVGAHRVLSSLEAGHPLRALAPHQPCATGQRWRWDGVDFEVLHPDDPAAARSNARSCVLRVAGRGGTALLAGDIEALQELRLVERFGERLAADVLLVPHHGSKTSSTPVFVHHVHPDWALVQAGYRNRFHHPAPSVVETYATQEVRLVRTDVCGAWHWSSADRSERCMRHTERRYWHARAPGDAGREDPATPDFVWP